LPKGEGIEVSKRADGALVITYHSAATPAEAVLAAVRTAGISIRDVKTEQADLQDVFLELTRSR
ncbi:MAG: ABC transporter ATP-binding protein, partial [Roseovarius sp.]|nr:ABC transporter ATP-binding protein [Roseovarius sp.]